MLRYIAFIIVLMLCTSALAGRDYSANNTVPTNVSGVAEFDSGLSDSPDTVLILLLHSLNAPVDILGGRIPSLRFGHIAQRVFGNVSIRSPPLTF